MSYRLSPIRTAQLVLSTLISDQKRQLKRWYQAGALPQSAFDRVSGQPGRVLNVRLWVQGQGTNGVSRLRQKLDNGSFYYAGRGNPQFGGLQASVFGNPERPNHISGYAAYAFFPWFVSRLLSGNPDLQFEIERVKQADHILCWCVQPKERCSCHAFTLLHAIEWFERDEPIYVARREFVAAADGGPTVKLGPKSAWAILAEAQERKLGLFED